MSDEQISTQEFAGTAEREHTAQLVQTAPRKTEESLPEKWLGSAEIDELQSRWNLIQKAFVDEPHTSVEQAKALVAEATDKVERKLSELQSSLNESIDGHKEISTEDLRISLQRYRSFFNRLLAL